MSTRNYINIGAYILLLFYFSLLETGPHIMSLPQPVFMRFLLRKNYASDYACIYYLQANVVTTKSTGNIEKFTFQIEPSARAVQKCAEQWHP